MTEPTDEIAPAARVLWERRQKRHGNQPTDEDWEIDREDEHPWVDLAFEDAHAAIAAMRTADTRADDVEQLRHKLRMIVSHATGGMSQDIDASVNDICVEISRSKNEVWKHAQEVALRDAKADDVVGDERPDFSRTTLRANIESVLRRYRDAHPNTMLEKIMSAIPVGAYPVEQASDDVVGELREALERHDAKVATCPIQKRSQSVCPRCKATSSDTCGVITGAEYAFVQDARAALSRAAIAEQEQK